MPEFESPEINREKKFEVVKVRARNGDLYHIFFTSVAEAEKAVRDFWETREGGMMVKTGLKSGMLHPSRHTITSGDRTEPYEFLNKEQHPGMAIGVTFNGNTEALSPKGVEALRKLGFIE